MENEAVPASIFLDALHDFYQLRLFELWTFEGRTHNMTDISFIRVLAIPRVSRLIRNGASSGLRFLIQVKVS